MTDSTPEQAEPAPTPGPRGNEDSSAGDRPPETGSPSLGAVPTSAAALGPEAATAHAAAGGAAAAPAAKRQRRHRRLRKPQPMVAWYDPGQLLQTGVDVLVSSIVGKHVDQRVLESFVTPGEEARIHNFDKEEHRREFWLDFVADVGDGWNSTFAVAKAIAAPQLVLKDPAGSLVVTKAGSVLVFGGDLTYPVATRKGYEDRLLLPYDEAFSAVGRKSDADRPRVFAIPGNHDWYDSLITFTRLFCQGRALGIGKTEQRRSYFALKLPHGWWLVGTDVQLGSDIDLPQLQFFQTVRKSMADSDRVILCTPEPHWVYARRYGAHDDTFNESNLAFLEDEVFGRKVRVFMAGDLHHYRRHEARDRRQKITAGGGGAFLHPTHADDVTHIAGFDLVEKSVYPTEEESRRLGWRNLGLAAKNPKFGLLTGALYLVTAYAVYCPEAALHNIHELGTIARLVAASIATRPSAGFWILLVIGAAFALTDTHSKWYRRIAGPLHGLAHLGVAFFGSWAAARLACYLLGITRATWDPTSGWNFAHLALAGALAFVFGFILGPLVFGLYLIVSLRLKHHSNEAFSSLAVEDWKNFLRLRIDEKGVLRIFPIGIDRVGRRLELTPDAPSSLGAPERPDLIARIAWWFRGVHGLPDETAPRLIEPWIDVTKDPDASTGKT